MGAFEKFNYKTIGELQGKIEELKLDIELTNNLEPLLSPVQVGPFQLPNAMAIHPMEGHDGTEDGCPSELTIRRYKRYGQGGAGLIWFEATAVDFTGRSGPRQLAVRKEILPSFKDLVASTLAAAGEGMGENHRPRCILQLTHSGRYSKPKGQREPVIAFHDPNLDEPVGVTASLIPISDQELDALQEKYVTAALLAKEAGFDGVDIKSCHRYLLSELLAGYTREGKYGGGFENRSRFILETVEKVRAAVGQDFIVGARLNVFDALPYPYGWGVDQDDPAKPDLTEPKKLIGLLKEKGVSLLSVTMGNPYYKMPFIVRPFDMPVIGADLPNEHPLESAARHISLVQEVQQAEPDLVVVGAGYSWFRQFFGQVAAANLAKGAVKVVGLGRGAFAYPDFAKDLQEKGNLDSRKVCIACSKCTQIVRDGGRTGCVIRDAEVYAPIYKEGRARQTGK